MKNNGPIKRHPALVAFSKDHHFGLLLVWKIRQGFSGNVNPDLIRNYVVYFYNEDLQHHFKEEEDLLFSLLPTGSSTKKAIEDHTEIRQMISELSKDSFLPDDLKKFADKLEEHIRFEERVLFNQYQSELSSDQLDELGKAELNERRDIDLDWKDHFWIKSK